ncbi:nucleotidyltransferase domain-containing protein [Rahnella selenatireducens]|uniref:nucleotidyltransferase domain-containing protein n=1 Tax=Rahnella selenatireducens TaxID=3389797 RepID=UPI0039699E46
MNKIIKDNKLECLAVIGSHARGDNDSYSDVDLLGIVVRESHQMINVNKVNLAIYSKSHLRKMMHDGELFALHIKQEGIALVNEELFNDICSSFKYKDNYNKDRRLAFLMGSIILKEQSTIRNWLVANKRIAWCVRTYILSLMAENGNISFAKPDIAFHGHSVHKNISYQDFLQLINPRENSGCSLVNLQLLRIFLSEIQYCKPSHRESEYLVNSEGILKNTVAQLMYESYT